MHSQIILKKLNQLLMDEFLISKKQIDQANNETSLLEQEFVDSFGLLQFLQRVEAEFKISFDFSIIPIENLISLTNISAEISKLIDKKNG